MPAGNRFTQSLATNFQSTSTSSYPIEYYAAPIPIEIPTTLGYVNEFILYDINPCLSKIAPIIKTNFSILLSEKSNLDTIFVVIK
jgi:hypothetical protein